MRHFLFVNSLAQICICSRGDTFVALRHRQKQIFTARGCWVTRAYSLLCFYAKDSFYCFLIIALLLHTFSLQAKNRYTLGVVDTIGIHPQNHKTTQSWQTYLYEISDYEDNTLSEDDYETLCYMEEHPLNINTATQKDLEQLPFLTAAQGEEILEYINFHGAMLTLNELALIASLDEPQRRLLACFVYAGEMQKKKRPSLREILRYGRSELTLSLRQPLYERRGDNNGYFGYNSRHSIRYAFDAGDRLRFGLLGAQDSGEPFFSCKNGMGYDHYSFFVQMRNIGALENIVAGHFRLQFGMGLVVNTGFSLGKMFMLSTLGRQSVGIRPSLTRSSAEYMQGVAATVRLGKNVRASAFVSYRPIDATLNDSGAIRTIVTTGYHRTQIEMEKKNNSNVLSTGMNICFAKNGFHAGTTASYVHYNRNLAPLTTTKYRRYYNTGNDFVNVGVDYGYTSHVFTLSGETATDKHGAIATLNTISATLSERLMLMALYRYYSFKYSSVYAKSFSDGGDVRNEHGAYLGIEWQAAHNVKLTAYADFAHSPWARYRISMPSNSFDALLSLAWTSHRLTLKARYRMRLRYRDNEAKTTMVRYDTHRTRLSATYDFGHGWNATTQGDFALTDYNIRDRGYMVTESVNGQWRWLRFSLNVNYFHTDSYDSRLYAYERSPLNSFSFPSFYGHGLRYAILLRTDIGRKLMAIAKIGVTDYFDRSTIGTGLQKVSASSMADIDLQLRWRF